MVPPTNFNPVTDPDDATTATPGGVIKKDRPPVKTTTPNTDDGSKKPFKQVLDATMTEKKTKPIPNHVKEVKSDDDDDDDDIVSPFELAAKANAQKQKPQPTITATRVFHEAPVEDVNIAITPVDEDLPKALPIQPKTVDKTAQPIVAPAAHPKDVKDPTKPTEIKAPGPVKEDDGDKKDSTTVIVAAPHQVNPAPIMNAEVQKPVPVTNVRQTLESLAKSMIDHIEQKIKPGQTDTTITLKQPPIFEGTQIKITQYDSASKQFNLTFSDINDPTARALIASTANQKQLQQALIDKGYTCQMITVEQKIPGLASTQTGDVALGQPRQQDQGEDAGSSTDKEQK